jgi:hypothetical protein
MHMRSGGGAQTPRTVLIGLVRHPVQLLVYRWNWKAALLSPLFRAHLFLAANVTAGWRAAAAAAVTEFTFRLVSSGFYGAATQAFREAQPPWAVALTVAVIVPAISHSLELCVHWLRGTVNLRGSIVASVLFTVLSTLFNNFAMRRGALLVGEGEMPLWRDLARVPRLLATFLLCGLRLGNKHFHLEMFRKILTACNPFVKAMTDDRRIWQTMPGTVSSSAGEICCDASAWQRARRRRRRGQHRARARNTPRDDTA